MELTVNGKEIKIKDDITIKELLKELNIEEKVMAAAVNMDIVKKANWHTYVLSKGDKVEFLQFVGGG